MMNKILLLALLVTPAAWAQDSSEEAIILNQELQFLEETANSISISAAPEVSPQQRARPIQSQSLEERYFGEGSDDTIQTRTAAPRRTRSVKEEDGN